MCRSVLYESGQTGSLLDWPLEVDLVLASLRNSPDSLAKITDNNQPHVVIGTRN
jgi:hypothetical protein